MAVSHEFHLASISILSLFGKDFLSIPLLFEFDVQPPLKATQRPKKTRLGRSLPLNLPHSFPVANHRPPETPRLPTISKY